MFTNYGAITSEELEEQKKIMCDKTFDIQQSLVIILYEMEELEQVAIAANYQFTGTQLVNIGIKLIKKIITLRQD